MTRDEIVDGVGGFIRQHKDGLRGSIHQEPYKGDLFRFFADAFNQGLISGPSQPGYLSADALADTLGERVPEIVGSKPFQELHAMWGEWTYAWRHVDQLSRR
jgi:hypothetical protein